MCDIDHGGEHKHEDCPNNFDPFSGKRSRKPRLIVLVRHGESASNLDKLVNEHTPNHMIPLTEKGWSQAHYAGVQLLNILNVDDQNIVDNLSEKYDIDGGHEMTLKLNDYKRLNKRKDLNIVFYTSPYRRTRETLKGILNVIDEYNELNSGLRMPVNEGYEPCAKRLSASWYKAVRPSGTYENKQNVTNNGDMSSPKAVDINYTDECINGKSFVRYRVKDDPRIREQDFGNFQEVRSMQDVMLKRRNYGHFFFRFPQGESAADVYDRVASFQETLFRYFEKNGQNRKPRDVVVLVTHGIYCRVFLMKWFRWTYEEFESFINVPNGSVMVMELDEKIDQYILRTELPRRC